MHDIELKKNKNPFAGEFVGSIFKLLIKDGFTTATR
jgi:hypothetical protein